MPYDGNPKQFTKPDVFSVEGLIAWLEKQNPAIEYDFANCEGECLIGRYLLSTTGKMWHDHGLNWRNISELYRDLALIAVRTPYTYGAALERARKIAVRTPYTYGAALERARKFLGG